MEAEIYILRELAQIAVAVPTLMSVVSPTQGFLNIIVQVAFAMKPILNVQTENVVLMENVMEWLEHAVIPMVKMQILLEVVLIPVVVPTLISVVIQQWLGNMYALPTTIASREPFLVLLVLVVRMENV